MSQFVVFFESADITSAQYDAILNELGEREKIRNTDRPVHLAFQNGEKFCVIDVWNTEEAFMDFARNDLAPIFNKLGLPLAPPKVMPVHRVVHAQAESILI